VAPPEEAQLSYFDRALEAFRHQDYWAALRELDRFPAGEPVEPEVHCLRGTIFLQQERLDEAEETCQYLLALDPWHADAHFLMGMIFRQRDQVDAAIRSFKTAIYLQPEHRDAHFYLAEVYRGSGFVDEARREYRNTLNTLRMSRESRPSMINWTGLEDEMVRGACKVNLSKLENGA
jgi:Tfp pilus assembly protein PilF